MSYIIKKSMNIIRASQNLSFNHLEDEFYHLLLQLAIKKYRASELGGAIESKEYKLSLKESKISKILDIENSFSNKKINIMLEKFSTLVYGNVLISNYKAFESLTQDHKSDTIEIVLNKVFIEKLLRYESGFILLDTSILKLFNSQYTRQIYEYILCQEITFHRYLGLEFKNLEDYLHFWDMKKINFGKDVIPAILSDLEFTKYRGKFKINASCTGIVEK